MTKKCPKCADPTYQGRHVVTTKAPSAATLERWERQGWGHKATDGCSDVDPDGRCEHGHQSWMLRLGYI